MSNSKLNIPGSFIANPFFRLIAPVFLSLLVYFLVLLVFDSIDQLETNFFGAELILCIVISYLISETNHFLIIILNKKVPFKVHLSKRIIIQVTLSTIIIFAITSSAVAFYMKEMVGFTSYSSELIAFNSLYILFGWCLHAMYFSLVYLRKTSEIQLINEENRRRSIEIKMEASLNELKPKLLNRCLETIIALSYNNQNEADNYLGKIADYYRNRLTQKNELVHLNEEIKDAGIFIDIYKHWVNILLEFERSFHQDIVDKKIMHGTITSVIEYILETAILLPNLPISVACGINNQNLEIKCEAKPKLIINRDADNEILRLIESYKIYSQKNIEIVKENSSYFIKIPLLY